MGFNLIYQICQVVPLLTFYLLTHADKKAGRQRENWDGNDTSCLQV